MARKELSVELRQVTGKKVATLRRAGLLPGNIYGRGLESVSVQVSTEDLVQTLKAASANEVIDIKVAGERAARPVVVHKLQRNPLNGGPLHADFYQVSLREKMKAEVPIVVIGTSDAIETYNGVLMTPLLALQIEALPLDIPPHIEVDISALTELEATIHVRDLQIPSNVTVLADEDDAVVKIASPRVEVEELPEAEEEEETAAEAEGEEPSAEAESEGESESKEE